MASDEEDAEDVAPLAAEATAGPSVASLLHALAHVLCSVAPVAACIGPTSDVAAACASRGKGGDDRAPTLRALIAVLRHLHTRGGSGSGGGAGGPGGTGDSSSSAVPTDLLLLAFTMGTAGHQPQPLQTFDDAVNCYSSLMLAVRSEVAALGPAVAAAVAWDDMVGLRLAHTSGYDALYALTIPADVLLLASYVRQATLTAKDVDTILGVNLEATLAHLELPSYHQRVVNFGRLCGLALRDLGLPGAARRQPTLINWPSAVVLNLHWGGGGVPEHAELKSILATLAPVLGLADLVNVAAQPPLAESMYGGGSTLGGTSRRPDARRELAGDAGIAGPVTDAPEVAPPSHWMLLRGIVAIRGTRFVAMRHDASGKNWILVNGSRQVALGPHFSDVVTKLARMRTQPVMLFYQCATASQVKEAFRHFVARRVSRRDEALFGSFIAADAPSDLHATLAVCCAPSLDQNIADTR